jgi:hypothetical protein
MDVMNVKTFGAIGNGSSDDAPAIQAAANSIPDAGGILYFPQGRYRIVPRARDREPHLVGIELKARTWVLGSGDSSILTARGNPIMLLAQGVSRIRVSNLAFEMDVMNSPDNDYATILSFEGGSSDIRVEACSFKAVRVPANDHITLHAILAKGVKRFWIINNKIEKMQIKHQADAVATGFRVVGPGYISHNLILEPRNWGITAVHFTEQTEIMDLSITDNIIENPSGEGGIAVGTDGNNPVAGLKRLVIRGNIIQGRWTNHGALAEHNESIGILVRPARETEQILIEGNVIRKDGQGLHRLFGIKVDACEPTSIKSLTIVNNTIWHTEYPAIEVNGDQSLTGFTISGNTIEQSGGIVIRRGIISDGIVTSNIVNSGDGLRLNCVREGDMLGPLLVLDNIFRGATGGGNEGIRLEASLPNTLISANVSGNRCSHNHYGIHEVSADEGAQGSYDTRYFDNDIRGNTTGMQVAATAVLRDNRNDL